MFASEFDSGFDNNLSKEPEHNSSIENDGFNSKPKHKAAKSKSDQDGKSYKPSLFRRNPELPVFSFRQDVVPIKEPLFSEKLYSDYKELHPHMVANLEQTLNITKVTAIQEHTIPVLQSDRDALIRSQTGSGKTLAYAIPIIEKLHHIRPKLTRKDGMKVMIVLPTRELAIQTYEWFVKLVKPFTWLVPGLLIGGEKRKSEKASEISPILYGAPWILTIFASQFPLGFVVRIFDLIFVEGSGVLFKVILALLSHHKDALLACDGFETIMDYLKITVPEIDKNVLDLVIKQVSTTDITKPLLEYNVEYHVLQEELSTPRPETKKLKQMEEVNKALKEKNQSLMEQLEIALSNNSRLETVRVKHLSQINKLESEVRTLEVTVNTLGNFISSIAYGKSDIEIPNDVLRILSQLNMAERRRSLPKSSLTDLNVDFKTAKDQNITLGQIKSNSLTPKMGSSYFANSFDQIRQQKLNQLPNNVNNKKLQEVSDSGKLLTKSLSDTRNIKFDKIIEESTDRSQSLGRVLSPQEMETLKLFQKNYSKELRKSEDSVKKAPMLSSKSSFELGVPSNLVQAGDNSPYPLNCGGVQISFAGSTKLKSLRPSRIKTEMHINVPKNLIHEHSLNSKINSSADNNDSAFDESVESIDSNGNLSDKAENTVSAVQDSKLGNTDITIS